MDQWYKVDLPFIMRVCNCISQHGSCPEAEQEVFRNAYAVLAEEYSCTDTMLAYIRDYLNVFSKGQTPDKLWYINHLSEAIDARREEVFTIPQKCPQFMTLQDTLNSAMDRLQVPRVKAYEPPPPPKTVDNLKHEQSKIVCKLIEEAMSNDLEDPNDAFSLAMTLTDIINNESILWAGGEFQPLKLSSRTQYMSLKALEALENVLLMSGFYISRHGKFIMYDLRSSVLDHETLLRLHDMQDEINSKGASVRYAVLNVWSECPAEFKEVTGLKNEYYLVFYLT